MFPDCLRRHGKPGPSIPGLLNDILIVAQVGNPNDRAVGQRAMRGCHFLGVITLAAGCLSALELFAVP